MAAASRRGPFRRKTSMSIVSFSWFRWHLPRRPSPASRPGCRPQLEELESRWVPATGGTPNQNFVNQLYQDYLHRTADQGGLTYWSGLLDQGRLNRPQV